MQELTALIVAGWGLIGLPLEAIAPDTVTEGLDGFDGVTVAAVRAVQVVTDFGLAISNTPPAVAGLAGKMVEIFERNLHADVVCSS